MRESMNYYKRIRARLTRRQRAVLDAMPFQGGVQAPASARTMEALLNEGVVRTDGVLYFLKTLGDYVQAAGEKRNPARYPGEMNNSSPTASRIPVSRVRMGHEVLIREGDTHRTWRVMNQPFVADGRVHVSLYSPSGGSRHVAWPLGELVIVMDHSR